MNVDHYSPLHSRRVSQASFCSASSKKSNCRICLSSFMDPAELSCGHRFCETCLEAYWHIRDEPDSLTCPLCRGDTSNIDFSKKDNKDTCFRKAFAPRDSESEEIIVNVRGDLKSYVSLMCLKISIIVPLIYFMAMELKPFIVNLFTFLQYTMGYGYRL